jgi:hypothetical protein
MHVIQLCREAQVGGLQSRLALKQDTISKLTKRAGGMAQVVECLLSMYEALGSNPNTEEKN